MVTSPWKITNVRLFILFRLFFNARFYYPVFSILFLDFGLNLSQFAILNAVWAATIVLCEVPSGALADMIGRRNMLVFAATLMVVEVALWAFAPLGNMTLLFWIFVLNRILSGVAEAAASGADEALAYDSLKREGDSSAWGQVLERQIQVQAVGFIIAMTLGGVLYDPSLMQHVTDVLGLEIVVTGETTLRLPIYLTLLTSLLTLWITLLMRSEEKDEATSNQTVGESLSGAFTLVWQAGRWIFRTPFVLGIILFGLLFDSVARMLITMASQYYRLVEIHEAWFGVLGSVIAVCGFFAPTLMRRLTERYSALTNLLIVAAAILIGLCGMVPAWPVIGVIPAMVLFSSLYAVGFVLSHYLNEAADSAQRATVLSFKGLFFNLGYGVIGILYSLLLVHVRVDELAMPGASEQVLKNMTFQASLPWFVGYFICFLLPLLFLFGRALKSCSR